MDAIQQHSTVQIDSCQADDPRCRDAVLTADQRQDIVARQPDLLRGSIQESQRLDAIEVADDVAWSDLPPFFRFCQQDFTVGVPRFRRVGSLGARMPL